MYLKLINGYVNSSYYQKQQRSDHTLLTVYSHIFQAKVTFFMRIILAFHNILKSLMTIQINSLIQHLLSHLCNSMERTLLSLPIKFAAMGFLIFSNIANMQTWNMQSQKNHLQNFNCKNQFLITSIKMALKNFKSRNNPKNLNYVHLVLKK